MIVYPMFYQRLCRSCPAAPALPWLFQIPVHLLSAFLYSWVLLLVLVRLTAPSPRMPLFPTACRGDTPNCTRVANYNVRGVGLEPPTKNASLAALDDAVLRWIRTEPRTTVLLHDQTAEGAYYVHARFLSLFLGFPDDFYASSFCNATLSEGQVWVQSQARLGTSDSGVNDRRVRDFIEYLDARSVGPSTSCRYVRM